MYIVHCMACLYRAVYFLPSQAYFFTSGGSDPLLFTATRFSSRKGCWGGGGGGGEISLDLGTITVSTPKLDNSVFCSLAQVGGLC